MSVNAINQSTINFSASQKLNKKEKQVATLAAVGTIGMGGVLGLGLLEYARTKKVNNPAVQLGMLCLALLSGVSGLAIFAKTKKNAEVANQTLNTKV